MYETQDAQAPPPGGAGETVGMARSLKTVDLGIDGLAPAVHLGSGGSANVFAAKQLNTGEAVAVKLLRASADSEKERVRFEREQETLQRLATHDGIVPVLDAGLTDREEPYFLMPLMEGSLQDRIDRDGALDWQTATQLIAEVADTVAFAHEQQVLHRDLKPGNVLLDGEGVPRVADFGIAKLMDSSVSKSSKSLGTPSFMPPERFNGHEATEESDVYGLGATLAALITGSAPFLTGENDTDVAVMMRVVTEEPPALEGHDVPEEVRLAVQQSMAKDPADRPATAAAFAQQLRMAIDPHLDPALAGPVTVAIPRRNITIPDGPATGGKGSTITIEDEDESRRKVPVWLLSAAALIIVAVVGAFALSALMGDDDGSDVATGDTDAAEQAETIDAVTGDSETGADGSDEDGDVSVEVLDETVTQVEGDATDGDATDGDAAATDGDGDGTDGGDGAVDNNEDEGDTTDGEGNAVAPTPPPPAEPVACFSMSASKVETGQRVSFTNCSTDATSYSWDLAGSSSSSANASQSWSTAGAKTIRLTARGEGGTHSVTKTVTVSETAPPPVEPTACFNASPLTVETGAKVTLSNCSTDATSYSWSFGDGTSSTSASTTKSWTTAGSKTVRLTATGPGGTDTASRTITVTAPAPPADACFTASKSTIEAGQSVSFSNCSKDATSYWWEFGDGGTSSQTSPSRTYNTAGTYTVKLTARGEGGDDATTRTITVNAPAVPAEACFTPNRVVIDAGDSITFTNCSKNATSYSWTFGDGGTSTQTSPSHTFNSTGGFTVRLTARGTGGNDTEQVSVTVNAVVITGDERVRPSKIGCNTLAANDWSWAWETLPSYASDYIVRHSDGSRVSLGDQPAPYRTSKNVTQIIGVDNNGIELATNVSVSDYCPAVSTVSTPTGVRCVFSNFRYVNDRWTWTESWSWTNDPSVSYRVRIEIDGALGGAQNVGGNGVTTDPVNGAVNSGHSLKEIIAVGADGQTATRTVSTCGSEGGTGWQNPT